MTPEQADEYRNLAQRYLTTTNAPAVHWRTRCALLESERDSWKHRFFFMLGFAGVLVVSAVAS